MLQTFKSDWRKKKSNKNEEKFIKQNQKQASF